MADSVQSTSKRVCLSNGEDGQEIDRISDLPDSVLCHILSFLPTKMSVATSILSKRWVDLWTTVPDLSFSSIGNNIHNSSRFVDSIYKVLAMYRVQTIHQFSMHCHTDLEVYGVHLETWINAAVRCKLQELKLNMRCPLVRLPDNVFACETLVSLELFGRVSVDVPAKARMGISSDNILVLDICVPSLKRFMVKRYGHRMGRPYKLLINAPLLERIELDVENEFWKYMYARKLPENENCKYFQVEDLPNLVEATIEVGLLKEDDFFRLFKGLAHVIFLFLSEEMVRSFCLPMVVLHVFRNLVYLDIRICCKNWYAFVPLLEYADNLSTLVFDKSEYHTGGYCSVSAKERTKVCVNELENI